MKFANVLTMVLVGSALAATTNNNNNKNNRLKDTSAHHVGVDGLTDEDNSPTAANMKKPLDPYGDEKLKAVDTPAIEELGDYAKTTGTKGSVASLGSDDSDNDNEGIESSGSFYSIWMSFSMIAVLEIGDKTFLIAALMAMKQPRIVVFTAAFLSLALMTILLGIVGHVLPALISPTITKYMASVLFLVFGFKLLNEGLAMLKDAGVDEEMAEVEEEISSANINLNMDDIEMGHDKPASNTKTTSIGESSLENFKNLASFVFSPVWIQVFVMTFLGEWGDRLQIATIAMAAGSDYWFVIIGAIVGHGLCTAGAVLGGKFLAKRISMRTVTIGGAVAFLVFAVMYFYDARYGAEVA